MAKKKVDLAGVFQAVTQSLEANQQSLDREDTYNHDHGTNMVQTFQTITSALEKKKTSSNSAALAYAAKTLAKRTSSGSGQLYAQHLSQAATQFKGKRVNTQEALQLLQTLIGSQGGAGSAGGGADMLGTLLGGMGGAGGQSAASHSAGQNSQAGSGDLLGALLGGLSGSGAGGQQANGLDMQDLLAAGMAFMQAKQQGKDNLQALVQALAAGSGMGSSPHRSRSTELVVQSYLQALESEKK